MGKVVACVVVYNKRHASLKKRNTKKAVPLLPPLPPLVRSRVFCRAVAISMPSAYRVPYQSNSINNIKNSMLKSAGVEVFGGEKGGNGHEWYLNRKKKAKAIMAWRAFKRHDNATNRSCNGVCMSLSYLNGWTDGQAATAKRTNQLEASCQQTAPASGRQISGRTRVYSPTPSPLRHTLPGDNSPRIPLRICSPGLICSPAAQHRNVSPGWICWRRAARIYPGGDKYQKDSSGRPVKHLAAHK